jgi:myo-inositol catabolism protein IolC
MSLGYNQPLYLLPFDHRHSYLSGLFHTAPPLTADKRQAVAVSKWVIYDGFKQAILGGKVQGDFGGILVDEEFGRDILIDARRKGYITAVSTEKSGLQEFEFEYGDAFADHIERFEPTFAKALVRFNPEGDPALNERQTRRLRRLSDYCRKAGQRFMFELLVPPTKAQLDRVGGVADYERQVRSALMLDAIRTLQDSGVEPDIWKVEGLHSSDECERVVEIARRHGRDGVSCIVLGHGADEEKVRRWLEIAASVEGFIGFAVGRTTFWNPISDFVARKITREQAASRIAERYGEWAEIFERARRSGGNVVGSPAARGS